MSFPRSSLSHHRIFDLVFALGWSALGCSGEAGEHAAPGTSDGASGGTASVGQGGSASITSGSGGGAVSSGGQGGAGGGFPVDPTSPPAITVDPAAVIPNTPLSTSKPALQAVTHPLQPGAFFGGHTAPLPTNAFWENMVLDTGGMLTNVFPYHVRTLPEGLGVSRPDMLTVGDRFCYESAPPQIVLGAAEAFSGRTIESWDPVSVSVRWQSGAGSMSAPVVYGMAYASGLYDGLTPKITSPVGIAGVNGVAAGTAKGTRFDVALKNGQHWILYTSEAVTVTTTANAATFGAPLRGFARLGLRTTAMTDEILDQYAGAVPTGAELRLSVQGDTGVVELAWKKQGTGEVLAMALPHQLEHLASPKLITPPLTTVRGSMRGVAGNLWQLQYALSPVLRTPPHALDETRRDAIVSALNADKGVQLNAGDSYSFGKQAGRAGELLLIAEALGQTAIADSLRGAIRGPLSDRLDGKSADALRYDQTWGGIVTSNGIGNSTADYGNGWYNDHHFHYGYLLFAAGAVAKGDAAWATQYKEQVLDLVRDIANPSASDPYFTQFRVFDWFDGHSWASGLFPFQDGRNQESSSEAFNAWVGISLFGEATGDKNLMNLGRIMRAVEAASVQRYYHIRKNSDVYPIPFRDRMVTGVLWSDKAEFSTFFGGGDEQIFGIQLLPMTIASEELIDSGWVGDAWPAMQASGGADSWRGFTAMAHAIIDKNAAWPEVTAINGVDGGNSHTNMLYWVATRP